MRLTYLLLTVQLLLAACNSTPSSDSRNFKIANIDEIRESLNRDGTKSEHWNYNAVYSGNLLDKNFHELLIKVNPSFIEEFQLDSQDFQFNFSAQFDSVFQVDSRSLAVSCNDIQELFIKENCLNSFLKELESLDYSSDDATVEYVIFSGSKACFGLGGQGWYYDYYMELSDSKAEVLLTQAIIE